MFERDKAELRELGIPLETGRASHFEAEDGYRIRRDDYELPEIEFDADEAAAVGLAARLWQSATLGEPARQALIKLRAAGTDVHAADAPGSAPQIDAGDPGLPALLAAARTATVVRFDYRKPRDVEAVDPHARAVGCAVLAAAVVRGGAGPRPRRAPQLPALPDRRARCGRSAPRARSPGRRRWICSRSSPGGRTTTASRGSGSSGPARGSCAGRPTRGRADGDDAELLTVTYSDTEWLARLVAAAGSGAVVLEPDDLRAAVVRRLRAVAGAR